MSKPRSQPLVSVICITYNQASYIRAALDGFLMLGAEAPPGAQESWIG